MYHNINNNKNKPKNLSGKNKMMFQKWAYKYFAPTSLVRPCRFCHKLVRYSQVLGFCDVNPDAPDVVISYPHVCKCEKTD